MSFRRHHHHASWSGSLSTLFGVPRSGDRLDSLASAATHPAKAPKDLTHHSTPLHSRNTNVPHAHAHPSVARLDAAYRDDSNAQSQNVSDPNRPQRSHRRTTSASSAQSYVSFPEPRHDDTRTRERRTSYSSSTGAPPLRHSRSRSESFSLPHHRSRSRVDSYNRPRSRSHSRPPLQVRFILPAALHSHLRTPPRWLRIVLTDPLPPFLCHPAQFLTHPATHPPRAALLLTSPHLPWPIRLAAPPPAAAATPFLTLHQVLRGLHDALRVPLTRAEYAAAGILQKEAVWRAYVRRVDGEHRVTRLDREECRGMSRVDGNRAEDEPLRRVDWLGGRVVFRGLVERDARTGVGAWEVLLGYE